MQDWRVLLGIGAIITLSGGVVGYKIGHGVGFKTGYMSGYESGENSNAKAQAKEAVKSAQNLEKEMTNAKKLSNDDVDAGLNSLGIMRNNEDR